MPLETKNYILKHKTILLENIASFITDLKMK